MGIPVCVPAVPPNAKAYVNAVIDKNWISSLCLDDDVNFIGKLERGFAETIGVEHCVCVNNGTAALHLAMATLGVGPGDEVIVPAFTMMATISAVIHNGATPVFVDCDERNWCMNANLVEQAVTERTKVIMPVHIYGHPADMDPINWIAQKNNILVAEDAAEAIGTVYKGKMAGNLGDMSCFSFYANKMITCGEGGILATNNAAWAKRATMLKDQGFGESRFIHEEIGYNFRMNNITAAYAYASLEKVDEYIRRRRKNAELYNQGLAGIEGITLPPEESYARNSYWMYGILIDEEDFGHSKAEVRQILQERYKIDTRDFFCPMHMQPALIDRGLINPEIPLPVSEKLWNDGFYLPSSTYLETDDVEFIVASLEEIKKRS